MLRRVASPYLTEADPDPKGELSNKGRLAPIAAQVVMQIRYAARVVRFDLLNSQPAAGDQDRILDAVVR